MAPCNEHTRPLGTVIKKVHGSLLTLEFDFFFFFSFSLGGTVGALGADFRFDPFVCPDFERTDGRAFVGSMLRNCLASTVHYTEFYKQRVLR